MKHKWRNIGIALAIVLVILGVLVFNFRSGQQSNVEAYRKELIAAGEKLTIAELIPPRVPAASNSVSTMRDAFGRLNRVQTFLETNAPPAMRMVAPGKAMVGWRQPDIRGDGINSWAEVEQALADHRDVLELLRQSADRPALDFELDYRQGANLLLPHLGPLKKAIERLANAVAWELHTGDTAAAASDLQVMLALTRAFREDLLISQASRMWMASIISTSTWELLQSPGVTDAQLAAVQAEWSQLEFMAPYEQSLLMGRAIDEMMFAKMKRGDFRDFYGDPTPMNADVKENAAKAAWRILVGRRGPLARSQEPHRVDRQRPLCSNQLSVPDGTDESKQPIGRAHNNRIFRLGMGAEFSRPGDTRDSIRAPDFCASAAQRDNQTNDHHRHRTETLST